MKKVRSKFRIKPGAKLNLRRWPTDVPRLYKSDEHYERMLAEEVAALDDLQRLQYAHARYAVLAIFQAMDAAGKDSAIRNVLSGVNPQGFQVHAFKQPSSDELAHDFLWRTTLRLPERGRLGIFNRSYYEEVLVVRVHRAILEGQNLPEELVDDQNIWRERFRSIAALERHLHFNGTRIVKFFLHVSREEQRKRLLARIEEPDKNWKFSMADIGERKLWPRYLDAYEECLRETSTKLAPWYAVPADDKKNARLIVARILVETFRELDMKYPDIGQERRKELGSVRKSLMNPED